MREIEMRKNKSTKKVAEIQKILVRYSASKSLIANTIGRETKARRKEKTILFF